MTTEELIAEYDFLSYFYFWIEPYLQRYIDDNPEVEIYKNQPIKLRCIEVYEEQYEAEEKGNRKVPTVYKKRFK